MCDSDAFPPLFCFNDRCILEKKRYAEWLKAMKDSKRDGLSYHETHCYKTWMDGGGDDPCYHPIDMSAQYYGCYIFKSCDDEREEFIKFWLK